MRFRNIIKNEIRMLLKRKLIVILLIAFLMVVPYIAIINSDTPSQYDHYYYSEVVQNVSNASISGGVVYFHTFSYKGFVLNKCLQPMSNTSILFENITVNGGVSLMVRTNSGGVFNTTVNYTNGIPGNCLSTPNNYVSERPQNLKSKNFQLFFFGNYFMNFYIPGVHGSQSDTIYLKRNFIQNLNGTNTNGNGIESTPGQQALSVNVSYSILPYYNLGLYGVAPVIYNGWNKNISLFITQSSYDSKTATFQYIPNSTEEINVSAHSVVQPFGYSQILKMNENGAISITYSQGSSGTVVLDANTNYIGFGQSFSIFAYLLGTLVVSLIVISVITEIYGLPERDVYTSIPHKRRNIVFLKFFAGIITLLLTVGFGVIFGDIIDLFFYHSLLDSYVILISTIILFSIFLLVSPIYLFLESKKTLSSGTRSLVVFVITLFLPIVVSIGMGALESYLNLPIFALENYLTKPLINEAGEINLIFSIIPFSAPIEFMEYLTFTPFPGVIMFNHRSLFMLTPLLIIPDLFLWFAIVVWFSVKRYERN
ncbi:hypothetical protein ACNF42_02435 [Cuniculiplasma sp. SKW3]|uniref:hypothetical protein n=1 Tax=Cuniculiplasma sp. SKW3 TaxID=3400170 RepID=UPI003FD0E2EA